MFRLFKAVPSSLYASVDENMSWELEALIVHSTLWLGGQRLGMALSKSDDSELRTLGETFKHSSKVLLDKCFYYDRSKRSLADLCNHIKDKSIQNKNDIALRVRAGIADVIHGDVYLEPKFHLKTVKFLLDHLPSLEKLNGYFRSFADNRADRSTDKSRGRCC